MFERQGNKLYCMLPYRILLIRVKFLSLSVNKA